MICSIRNLSVATLFTLALAAPASAANFLPVTTTGQGMMTPGSGYSYKAVYTVGDTLPNSYQSVGIFDGIGAYALNASTVRLLVSHELGSTAGKSYSVSNGIGGSVNLTGARVSFFDIDRASLGVVNAGQAYDRIYDRAGNIVANASQINGGFSRFCSSAAFEANSFGAGKGLADRAYFTGEETANGTMYVLDTASNQLYAAPAMGRGAWENATQIDTGTANKVAFIISDDTSGNANDYGSPIYMYVGTKNAKGDGSFLDRNGLADGKMYVWASNGGDANPTTFNSNGSTRDGKWVEIKSFDPAKAGTPGYDALGYADQATLRASATAAGAFRFSRPEDVATNPGDGKLVALASTGSSLLNGADQWGTIYTLASTFDANGNPTGGTVKIVYDGNKDAAHKLRSPDNLTWSGTGELLIQEDNATNWAAGGNLTEAQVVKLKLDGTVTMATVMDRLALQGGTDTLAGQLGAWESSGILDVSSLWGLAAGTLFVGDVQAHGLLNGTPLVEGGQLFFLRAAVTAVPEPATWLSMIVGFGAVGTAARRRGKVRVRSIC
jgi:serralysin